MYSLDDSKKSKADASREKEDGEFEEIISGEEEQEEEEGEIVEIIGPKLRNEERTKRRRLSHDCGESTSNPSIIESKPIRKSDYRNDDRRNGAKTSKLRSQLNQIGPVRLIVEQSDTLDRGSLLLVTCMAGKIGQHSNCAVTIPDATISQVGDDHVRSKLR